ncbi:GntR family transcriptional regulator [Cupriavidus pinatubonensis]|uniref:GntR family transcriptional regulator n=1 Tax=Cupriavidus pinatubonensis TaxID=248026 RepID=UPI00360DC45A
MERLNGRTALLIQAGLLAVFAARGAYASDIACTAPLGGALARCAEPYGSGVGCEPRAGAAGARKEHLICEYTMLSERYEQIYAEQQRMLRKGAMQNADLAAWRAKRDACDSVRCMDSVFHMFWRQRDAMLKAPVKQTFARSGASDNAAATTREAASRPAVPVPKFAAHDAPAAAVAPAPIVAPASIVAPRPGAGAPIDPSALAEMPERPRHAAPVPTAKTQPREKRVSRPLILESLASGLAVLGAGAGFVWNRRRSVPQEGEKAIQPGRIPAMMMVAYGLLLLNALLLPFTLGLR